MPIGLDHGVARLGSLDFLHEAEIATQFALDDTQLETTKATAGKSSYAKAMVPQLDLCVMNPPFVSSRYGNRLFGSLPEDRPALQRELSRRARALCDRRPRRVVRPSGRKASETGWADSFRSSNRSRDRGMSAVARIRV